MSVKRAYKSTKRAAQALATRRAILDAAAELFVEQGYATTTIQAISESAGVAVQTVYAVFGSKREIVRELLETAVTGHDDSTSINERDEALAIGAEPDPRKRAAMDAAYSRAATQRVAPMYRVAREAAASDAEVATVLKAVGAARRKEMVAAAKLLAGPNGRLGNAEQAAATLYVLYSPDVADMLMGDYGWSAAKYEKWLAGMLLGAVIQPGLDG